MITTVNIDASKLDTQERIDKMTQVAIEMHRVLNSKIFMDGVLRMKKHGERSKYINYSNTEIYQMIMKGAEVLDPVVDYELDIFVDDYYSFKRVIGYTYANTKTVFVNTKYFDTNSARGVGSNILHEYGHKLGFGHDFRSTSARPYSICYQLNKIYEDCHRKLYSDLVTSKVKYCYRSWKTLWLKKYCYWREE